MSGNAKIETLVRALSYGRLLTQPKADALAAEWEPRIQPGESDRSERYSVALSDGSSTGVTGPRWLFHLLGLRHHAVHIGLCTLSGLVVLQRRSITKAQWPDMLDMAVAGHVPLAEDGTPVSLEMAAWKEMEEEIGLPRVRASEVLAEGKLIAIGAPYNSLDVEPLADPPFYNAEIRHVFAGTLTETGLAAISFSDGEVSSVVLATPEQCWSLLAREHCASGMRYSLPRYLDYLAIHSATGS